MSGEEGFRRVLVTPRSGEMNTRKLYADGDRAAYRPWTKDGAGAVAPAACWPRSDTQGPELGAGA